MMVYHGTDKDRAQSIQQNGFDSKFIGSNWGSTYGPGFYFSPNLQEAMCYGEAIIECEINIQNPFKLNKLNRKITKELQRGLWQRKYDALIDPTGNEVIIPSNQQNQIKITNIIST